MLGQHLLVAQCLLVIEAEFGAGREDDPAGRYRLEEPERKPDAGAREHEAQHDHAHEVAPGEEDEFVQCHGALNGGPPLFLDVDYARPPFGIIVTSEEVSPLNLMRVP